MRRLLEILAACLLLLLHCAHAEYNYDKPKIPFHTGEQPTAAATAGVVQGFSYQQQTQGVNYQVQHQQPQQQAQQQVPIQPPVQHQQLPVQHQPQQVPVQQVQPLQPIQHVPLQKTQYYTTTSTAHGNRYVIEMTPSRQIFEANYGPTVTGETQQIVAQGYNNYNSQAQAGAQYAQQPHQGATFVQQQQGAAFVQQQQPQQNQQPRAIQQQSGQYFGASQQHQQQNAAGFTVPQPQQQYATNFGQANYNQGQQYNTPNINPLLPNQQGYNAASSAYQYAAQAAANAAQQFGQQATLGHYVAQSQVTQLDNYPYKQLPPGETRGFQRMVRTCNAQGQCSEISLGSGQTDPVQQQLIYATRARIAPLSNKCQQKAAVSSYYRQPVAPPEPVRPKDRRMFPYSEVSLPGDPYN